MSAPPRAPSVSPFAPLRLAFRASPPPRAGLQATACNMLCTYAQELRAGFFPYVGEVANVMGELVAFEYTEDVRIAAAQTLPELVRCAALAHEAGSAGATAELVQQLLHFSLTKVSDQVVEDVDSQVRRRRRRRSWAFVAGAACSAAHRLNSRPALTCPPAALGAGHLLADGGALDPHRAQR